MRKNKANEEEIKKIHESSPLSLDKHGFNWTIIITAIIILLGVCIWSIFDKVISKFTLDELKSCFSYITTYVAGMGTVPILRNMMTFIDKLIKNKL